MQASAGRLPSLTGCRFLAALAVGVNHLTDAFVPDLGGYLGELSQAAGRIGVSFFFVLSGFVLTWSAADRHGTVSFYRRRLARIGPLHVVTWILALGVLAAEGARITPAAFALGLLLLQAWHPARDLQFAGNAVALHDRVEVPAERRLRGGARIDTGLDPRPAVR